MKHTDLSEMWSKRNRRKENHMDERIERQKATPIPEEELESEEDIDKIVEAIKSIDFTPKVTVNSNDWVGYIIIFGMIYLILKSL